MKGPNFFIAGAPKCGTSSLAMYLGEHPSVYMCLEKEPHYFSEDFPGIRQAVTLEEYLALFEQASDAHVAVGEASVNYLHSRVALENIRAYDGNARIVVLLRNPVDQAPSMHSQMVFGLYEDEEDFERAWDLQGERAAGRRIPKRCTCPEVLQYGRVASYAGQVARLFESFPRDRVRVYLTDDLQASAKGVYEDVLAFVGVDSDGRTEFPRVNENKVFQSALLARMTERPPGFWVAGARMAKRALGLQRIGLLRWLREMNKRKVARAPLSPAFRERLVEEFREDVLRLQDILERDLSAWLEPVRESAAPGEDGERG